MNTATVDKLASVDVQLSLARIEPPPGAAGVVAGLQSAHEVIEALVGGGFLLEATRFLAHALPRREAVWWSCMCARHTAPGDLPKPDTAALNAAEEWVRRTSDENRRAAFAHAQDSGFGTPEAWAAVAAFWCGDSMSPLGQVAVPPAPHLAGTAVAGAVALASVRVRPGRQAERLARFVDSAREIAAGATGRIPPEAA